MQIMSLIIWQGFTLLVFGSGLQGRCFLPYCTLVQWRCKLQSLIHRFRSTTQQKGLDTKFTMNKAQHSPHVANAWKGWKCALVQFLVVAIHITQKYMRTFWKPYRHQATSFQCEDPTTLHPLCWAQAKKHM
jgi:hypothetical protein